MFVWIVILLLLGFLKPIRHTREVHEVLSICDVKQGIEQVKIHSFDLIITGSSNLREMVLQSN